MGIKRFFEKLGDAVDPRRKRRRENKKFQAQKRTMRAFQAKHQNPYQVSSTYDRLAGKSHLSKFRVTGGKDPLNRKVVRNTPFHTLPDNFQKPTSRQDILDSFQRARNLPKTTGRGPQPRMGSKSGGEAGFSNTAQRIRMRDRKAKANTDRFGAI